MVSWSRNLAGFSSEKISRKSRNSFGTCSLNCTSSFLRFNSACIFVAIDILALIHVLVSISSVIEETNNAKSLLSRGFWVKLRWSSSSSSLKIVAAVLFYISWCCLSKKYLMACFANFLAISKGLISLGFLHSKVPFSLSMMGFVFLSQGSPKMILCFPNPVTKSCSFHFHPCILMFRFI